MCVAMSLGPSPLMFIALVVAIIWALSRVLSRADSEEAAIRILDRTAAGIMIVAAASIVVAQVWFALIPLDGINGSGSYLWPFPFGSVDLQIEPMTLPQG